MIKDIIWDVAVIGGGPAGMMAAGRAAERGLRVVLIEKNGKLGEKLLITGGGRSNITNEEFDTRKFLAKFKGSDKYLFSAFSKWNVEQTLGFFHSHEMATKTEAEGRVFPLTNRAQSVWDVLVQYMRKGNVTILSNVEVTGFKKKGNLLAGLALKQKEKVSSRRGVKSLKEIQAKTYILATGGKSHPETGSTGEGFEWLKAIGHTVEEPSVSLVPITLKDNWVKKVQGITLKNIKISIYQNGVRQPSISRVATGATTKAAARISAKAPGKILFTHFGVSGPTILNMSKDVRELLKYGDVILSLDMLPSFDHGKLNAKLQEIFKIHSNKKFKNSLGDLVPAAFAPVVAELANIDDEIECNSVTREQRMRIIEILKGVPMRVKGFLGVQKAIITSGGIKLDEVDFRTMSSRMFPNLRVVGDILNIDRPSGGYSLQLCWTTGFVAGDSA